MKQTVFIGLIVALLVLIAARPWGKLNQAVGIHPATDSLRSESPQQEDSLIIEQVALTLPQTVSDSLTYTVNARQKKKQYLEEQSAWLQKENLKLEEKLKAKKKQLVEKQQALVSLNEIDALLSKQNQSGKQDASNLKVSDLETELNQRSGGRKNRNP